MSLTGFRLWHASDGGLRSLGGWTYIIPWSGQTVQESAWCGVDKRHVAPDFDCNCGLYAWFRPPTDRMMRMEGVSVSGVVRLSGHVIWHDTGWRAQHMRIVALADPNSLVDRARYPSIPIYRTMDGMLAEWDPDPAGGTAVDGGVAARRIQLTGLPAGHCLSCRELPKPGSTIEFPPPHIYGDDHPGVFHNSYGCVYARPHSASEYDYDRYIVEGLKPYLSCPEIVVQHKPFYGDRCTSSECLGVQVPAIYSCIKHVKVRCELATCIKCRNVNKFMSHNRHYILEKTGSICYSTYYFV